MIKVLCIVGLIILVGFVVVAGLAAWLLARARKEIDKWNIDLERL